MCLPSGTLPQITIPICLSTLKTLLLVFYTKSCENTNFSAPRMTPSLHLTPTTVLFFNYKYTMRFQQL
jgi:hypothetical protein